MASRSRAPRRWRRTATRLTVVLASSLALCLGVSSAAWANGSWSWSEYTGCSKVWNTNQYGGYAVVHANYTADTDQTDRATVTNSVASVPGLYDCGFAGRAITAYKITVTAEYWFYATGIDCTVGYSLDSGGGAGLSYSCQDLGDDIKVNIATTCSTNVYSCSVTVAKLNIYPKAGMKMKNYMYMATLAALYGASGNAYYWEIDRM